MFGDRANRSMEKVVIEAISALKNADNESILH